MARQLVAYVVGFGVSVAIGMAPFLGTVDTPLFRPLLTLVPEVIRDTVVPLSAILMGFVAVTVEWFGKDLPSRRELAAWFKRGAGVFLAALALLLVVHTFTVVKVPFGTEDGEKVYVVGFERPDRAPCREEDNVSDSECIARLTLDPGKVEGFWGDRQVRVAKLSLMAAYLLFTSSFAALIGLVVVRAALKRR